MKKYIIFGTGHDGRELLNHIDADEIAFFADNNTDVVGNRVNGIEIISFERLKSIAENYCVILAVSSFRAAVKNQFEREGIKNYIEYVNEEYLYANKMTFECDKQYYLGSDVNKIIATYVEKSEKINWDHDYEACVDIVHDFLNCLDGRSELMETHFVETHFYGQGKALMDYAGIKADYHNFPLVAHGPFFEGEHFYKTATIFSGNYDKKVHNDHYPYIPVFSVGPYIQYAKGLYEEDKLISLKNSNGKTLVIFLSHSIDSCGMIPEYSDDDIISDVEYFLKKYSKIMVCAYWYNIDREIYKKLNRLGITVVCAGLKFDEKYFLRRLRTYLDLADDVAIYGFTSAAIYALQMNKNLYIRHAHEEIYVRSHLERLTKRKTGIYDKVVCIFENAFGEHGSKILNMDEKQYLDNMFGMSIKRSPQEIQMMYEISKDIWKNCQEKELYYPIGVYKTYLEYQKNYEFDKLEMLTEACNGHKLWLQ